MQLPAFSKDHILYFHNIRDVSPQSHMYSVSFRLPQEVAFAQVKLEGSKNTGDTIYDEFEDKSRMKLHKSN